MAIPYRHRRMIQRVSTFLLALLLILILVWLCWVIWLQRYVVYTNEGATLNFELSSYEVSGNEPVQPKAEENIAIFYNEGADAIDTTQEMTQLNGYYITSDMFQTDLDNVLLQVARLPAGTAVMIDMKGPFGSFFYESKLPEAIQSASTNIAEVEALVKKVKMQGCYTVARISAFRDRTFGENHVSNGLYMLSRAGLWMDEGGMYWLDPTSATVTSWISSVVLELRGMGFDEVLLDDFRFPTSDKYIFNGDKPAALSAAANTINSACASSNFVLSFCVDDPTFALPEGRTRMYMKNIDASRIATTAGSVTFEEPELRLVFLCETGDTRYDEYSVLRSLNVAEEVEARKGN